MAYTLEHIATTLKQARERRGLSQRALSERAGVPQGHISKIENATVDLRLSSLIELARALDLELLLVPRNKASTVNALHVGESASPYSRSGGPPKTQKELERLRDEMRTLPEKLRQTIEFSQMLHQIRDLERFGLTGADLRPIRRASALLSNQQSEKPDEDTLRKALLSLKELRNRLAHDRGSTLDTDMARPAYSLDDDDG